MAKVTGLDSILKQLSTFKEEGKKATIRVVQASAFQVEAEAKQDAPKDLGKLAQSITKVSEKDGLRAKIEVGAMYAAFVEFGTGLYVDVPAELQQEALKFKGYKSGSFDEFLDAISDWCRRKGIPQEAWYPIAMSIMRKGIKPQPFLYPAFVKYRAEMKPKLSKSLERLIKEANARK